VFADQSTDSSLPRTVNTTLTPTRVQSTLTPTGQLSTHTPLPSDFPRPPVTPLRLPPSIPNGFAEGITFIEALGNLLAVGDTSGTLTILDISDPSYPRPLSNLPLGREDYLTYPGFSEDLPVAIRDAELTDNTVFIITVTHLIAIDVSDPSNPTEVGRLELPERLNDIQVRGKDLWIAVADTIGDRGRLLVVDTSKLSQPTLVNEADLPRTNASRVRLEGDLAYVTNREELTAPDLRLFSIRDPANPSDLGAINGLPAFRAWIRGSTAYIATGRRNESKELGQYTEVASIAMVSVSDPDDPHAFGYIWTPELASDLSVVGDNAFVIGDYPWWALAPDGTNPFSMWFNVADLRDPSHPIVTRTLDLEGSAEAVAYYRGYAYVAAGQAGLHIVSATAAVLIDTLAGEDLLAR